MFKFTIRELVMLTLIVGLALGLWIAQLQYIARQNPADSWNTPHDSNPLRTRAVYWFDAAHALQSRLVESGHSVQFVEGVGVKIDGRLIRTSDQPKPAGP